MTEIPEHLLQRSRERRAALGLGGDGGAGAAGAIGSGDAGGSALASKPAAAAGTPAAAGAPGAVGAAGAAKKAAPAIIEAPVEAKPAFVPRPTGPHKLPVPLWVMPVLVAIPMWAFFFPAAFNKHQSKVITDPIVLGGITYHSSCSTCHGTNGEGGVGPALHGGQSLLTFPNVADQIAWVKNGSMGLAKNQPYGDPNRTGGQRVASKNDMPAFGTSLTPTQIQNVVTYERTKL